MQILVSGPTLNILLSCALRNIQTRLEDEFFLHIFHQYANRWVMVEISVLYVKAGKEIHNWILQDIQTNSDRLFKEKQTDFSHLSYGNHLID